MIGNFIIFISSLQISILYLHSAIEKIYKLDEWVEGDTLYYFLNSKLFGASDWILFILSPLLESRFVFLISWGVIALEFLLFSALFMEKKNKLFLFKIGLVFHFLIALTFGLISFFFSMAGALTIYLLPDSILKNEKVFLFKNRISSYLG